MTKLSKIEGIGAVSLAKLSEVGIDSVEELLDIGKTPEGRKELSSQMGVSGRLILGWVNRADLARIKGVGEEYADLLDAAGVKTVVSLSEREAENLHARLVRVNSMKKLVKRVPAISRVDSWVKQAKELPQLIQY